MKKILLPLALIAAVMATCGQIAAADREQVARDLETKLIAPCCFSQQVSVHHSPAAAEGRRDIRARLDAGETPEQILDAYVRQHGNRVLAQPLAEGAGWVLYVLPVVALLFTAGLVVMIVRRFTGPSAGAASLQPATPPAADDAYRAALDDALRDLD